MKKIKNFFEFIVSFLAMYNSVGLVVLKDIFLEILPLAIVTPIAAFIIHVVGWHISWFKKINYVKN